MQEINKMKQQIQDHLDKVILPFWESLKDDEYGGFYGYMDIDLNVDKKAVKGCTPPPSRPRPTAASR